jgi:hypothetical protein
VNILEAIKRQDVLGAAIRDQSTFAAWLAFLAALFGLPMDQASADLFRACTARETLPMAAFSESWLCCGRRAGKSFVMALIAVYLATFRDYQKFLGIGERTTVMIVAADRRQARVIMRYVRGILALPVFAKIVENESKESFDLTNRVTIEIATASIKAVRGYSICAALIDEIAFLPQEDSASPDFEILDSIRPAMATIPGAVMICASSPYARRGALWDAYKRYFGKNDAPVLVWQAATRVMNPTVPQSVIDQALERDAASASAEYMAQFRLDIEAFISREAVEACVDTGVYERAPLPGVRYCGFTDASGGSGQDSYTVAIAHKEDKLAILDCVREVKPPFSPEAVTQQFAELLKTYHVSTVHGDRYAGEWPREQYKKHGVQYAPSEKTTSENYSEMLPLINSCKCSLLDNSRMFQQIIGLERKTARSGKDSISHAPGAHDDIAASVAGVLKLALGGKQPMNITDQILAMAADPRSYNRRTFTN